MQTAQRAFSGDTLVFLDKVGLDTGLGELRYPPGLHEKPALIAEHRGGDPNDIGDG